MARACPRAASTVEARTRSPAAVRPIRRSAAVLTICRISLRKARRNSLIFKDQSSVVDLVFGNAFFVLGESVTIVAYAQEHGLIGDDRHARRVYRRFPA